MRRKIFALLAAVTMLVLSLSSCVASGPELTERLTVSGLTVEVYSSHGEIVRLTVLDGDQVKTSLACKGSDVTVADLNFDGYDDLRVASSVKAGSYDCFLYQEKIKTFSGNAELSSLIEPVWDHENRQINCRVHKISYYSEKPGEVSGYRETRGRAVWRFDGGVLKQVYESGIYHDSDSELFCVYEATLHNGELYYDYAAEKWYYSADELASAGYVW